MLGLTPASYVLAYSQSSGIVFLPATSALAFGHRDLFEFNPISTKAFFQWHLAGFIGDQRLDRPHRETLEALERDRAVSAEFAANHILHIRVKVRYAVWDAVAERS